MDHLEVSYKRLKLITKWKWNL